MYLLIIFLPLLSAFTLLALGRFLAKPGALTITFLLIAFSFLCSLGIFYEVCILGATTMLILPIS